MIIIYLELIKFTWPAKWKENKLQMMNNNIINICKGKRRWRRLLNWLMQRQNGLLRERQLNESFNGFSFIVRCLIDDHSKTYNNANYKSINRFTCSSLEFDFIYINIWNVVYPIWHISWHQISIKFILKWHLRISSEK